MQVARGTRRERDDKGDRLFVGIDSQFSTSCRLLLSLRATKRKHGSLDIPVVRLEEVEEEQIEENEEDFLRKKKVVYIRQSPTKASSYIQVLQLMQVSWRRKTGDKI